MKKFLLSAFSLGLTLSLASASALSAGVVYTMETTESTTGGPTTVEVQAQDNRVKMNFEGNTDGSEFVIFDGRHNTLMIANPDEKSYVVLDRESLDRIRQMMEEAKRRLDQALAQVPESQREQMRQMMEDRMPGMGGNTSEVPELEVSATGESKTIEDYETKGYEVTVGGRKEAELWVVPWDEIEGSEDVKESFTSMANFFTQFMEAMPQAADQSDQSATWVRAMEKLDGFPVRSVTYKRGGEKGEETTLKSIRSVELKPSDFDVPDDYTRQSLDIPDM